jgi:hypothetical protein
MRDHTAIAPRLFRLNSPVKENARCPHGQNSYNHKLLTLDSGEKISIKDSCENQGQRNEALFCHVAERLGIAANFAKARLIKSKGKEYIAVRWENDSITFREGADSNILTWEELDDFLATEISLWARNNVKSAAVQFARIAFMIFFCNVSDRHSNNFVFNRLNKHIVSIDHERAFFYSSSDNRIGNLHTIKACIRDSGKTTFCNEAWKEYFRLESLVQSMGDSLDRLIVGFLGKKYDWRQNISWNNDRFMSLGW